jgi:hypothetical protein
MTVEKLITDHIDIWSLRCKPAPLPGAAVTVKSTSMALRNCAS